MTTQLLSEGVELEGHGGTVQLVHTSAVSGMGLADLQEALLLQVWSVCVWGGGLQCSWFTLQRSAGWAWPT